MTEPISPGTVREFVTEDASDLLGLMKDLAAFEGYLDEFAVTELDLVSHGLGENRLFTAYVIPDIKTGKLLAMAVTHVIPWTYDARPVLVLKELYITPLARRRGLGRRLLDRAIKQARLINASRLQWTVLTDNVRAKEFYQTLGGHQDPIWERWVMPISARDQ